MTMNDSAPPKTKRRWYQSGLWKLLLFTAACLLWLFLCNFVRRHSGGAAVAVMHMIALVPIMVIVGLLYGGRCPKCKRRPVFHKTGKSRKEAPLDSLEEEWKCDSCGYTEWRVAPHLPTG